MDFQGIENLKGQGTWIRDDGVSQWTGAWKLQEKATCWVAKDLFLCAGVQLVRCWEDFFPSKRTIQAHSSAGQENPRKVVEIGARKPRDGNHPRLFKYNVESSCTSRSWDKQPWKKLSAGGPPWALNC